MWLLALTSLSLPVEFVLVWYEVPCCACESEMWMPWSASATPLESCLICTVLTLKSHGVFDLLSKLLRWALVLLLQVNLYAAHTAWNAAGSLVYLLLPGIPVNKYKNMCFPVNFDSYSCQLFLDSSDLLGCWTYHYQWLLPFLKVGSRRRDYGPVT